MTSPFASQHQGMTDLPLWDKNQYKLNNRNIVTRHNINATNQSTEDRCSKHNIEVCTKSRIPLFYLLPCIFNYYFYDKQLTDLFIK